MSQLILDRKLLEAEAGDPAYTLAQARTATAMQSLNGHRNRSVIGFLNEVRLIGQGPYSIHLLAGIDLRDAGLHGAPLSSIDLSEATLNRANLTGANLKSANLDGAYLRDADLAPGFLYGATLRGAYLEGTNLSGAHLKDANLRYTNLSGAHLSEAQGLTDEQIAAAYSVEGATMPNGQK